MKKVPTTSGRKTTQLTQLEIITITNTYKSSRMHYTYMSEVTSGGRHERTPYTTVSIWRNGLYSLWMERRSSTLSLAAILLKSGPLFATLSSLASFREDEEDDTGDRSYFKKFPWAALSRSLQNRWFLATDLLLSFKCHWCVRHWVGLLSFW